MDDDFGGYDDFDEFNDWDATQCADGDYNAFEDEQVFQDGVADREEEDFLFRRNEAACVVAAHRGGDFPTVEDFAVVDRMWDIMNFEVY